MIKKLLCGIFSVAVIVLTAVNVNLVLNGDGNSKLMNLMGVESLAQSENGGDESGCYTRFTIIYEENGVSHFFECQQGSGDECLEGYTIFYLQEGELVPVYHNLSSSYC